MVRLWVATLCSVLFSFALLTGCSSQQPDQEAIDAAVEKALAERDRAQAQEENAGASSTYSEDSAPEEDAEKVSYSKENLREGYFDGQGSPYWMCTRTLSIVGEYCGCMVNRATDAGIENAAQVGMFGGDGKRATSAQVKAFTEIVRSCSGYNITVRGAKAAAPLPKPAKAEAAKKGRVVTCEYDDGANRYNGPCEFVLGRGGSFSARSLDGPFYGNVSDIELIVEGKGVGTLVVLWPSERNGRFMMRQNNFPVQRSQSDRACWGDGRVRFCAR